MLRLAMAQMLVEGGRPGANLERAVAHIQEAARLGCRLVVLPECMDLGWTDPSARELAQPIPGPHSDLLAHAARTHGILVVAGLVERAGDRRYNAAVLIDTAGSLRLLYRKINELEMAQDLYVTGDRLSVAETGIGVLGVNICADNFPGSLAIGHVLARMGAQIILSPSAWAVDAEHANETDPYGSLWLRSYRELSASHDLPVVGVSSVGRISGGPWEGRKLIGCSLAIGSDGRILAQGPYGEHAEALIPVDVELRAPKRSGSGL